MKRIVFVCNIGQAFPRVPGLANGMRELGWEVEIITPYQSSKIVEDLKILRSDIRIQHSFGFSNYKNRSKILHLFRITNRNRKFLALIKFFGRIWNQFMLEKKVTNYVKKNKIDLLFTTQEPFYIEKIAAKITKKFQLFWIADQLDLWGNNHVSPKSTDLRNLEIEVLSNCAIITTVSEPLRHQLINLTNKTCYVITGGYLAKKSENFTEKEKTYFSLEYTGQIYLGYQNFVKMLNILSDYNREFQMKCILTFSGSCVWTIQDYFRDLREEIPDYIILKGDLSHEDAMQGLYAADAFVILEWEDLQQKGILSKKLFEYLSFAKPILVFGKNEGSELQRILDETKTGIEVNNKDDLSNLIQAWSRNQLRFQANSTEIEKYFYGNHAVQLQEIYYTESGKK